MLGASPAIECKGMTTDDFDTMCFTRAVMNTALQMTALRPNTNMGAFYRDPAARKAALGVGKELETLIAVVPKLSKVDMNAKGLGLYKKIQAVHDGAEEMPDWKGHPSFQADVQKGIRTEAQWLYGSFIELGEENGVPTPFLSKVLELMEISGSGKALDMSPEEIDQAFTF